ncbi:MAG TPA: FkbM family methyltransferase [Saprospiraceae bacterium]|nr:FkbM family methyltransferase [Saprospiraceae bacterium]
MSIKSILAKTGFCFSITPTIQEGCKLLYWTFLLVFYSRFFQQALANNKRAKSLYMNTRRGPMEIKLRLQDVPIFYEMFFSNAYYIPEKNISEGNVLDIGAHIGLASIYFWDKHFHDAKFYCVEPSKENLQLLEYNTRLLDRTIINVGISDHNGYVSFDTSGFGHNYKIDINGEGKDKIEICTIDRLFENYGIGEVVLLKMDIEGEEEKVIKSKYNWINSVKILLLEVHGNYSCAEIQKDIDKKGHLNKHILIKSHSDICLLIQ